jgi:multisubunit Na+/H+ antiporter MnhF subunit
MTAVALALLVAAALLLVVRSLLGPGLADRVVALDALLSVVATGIIVAAAHRDDATVLDSAVVVALVGFIGTAVVARYIERRGP